VGDTGYQTRVQKFSLDVNPTTGAISNFNLLSTIQFTNNGLPFNGFNPEVLNGSKSDLGRSLDPEGFAVAPNGNFYVSDEYGPSVLEFNPQGQFVRSFTTPENLKPKESSGTLNFVDGRPTIVNGRQDNRGFEGLTLSPDGKKLYAVLQDPLVNEGDRSDGRRSRNVRMVEFDTTTGQSTKQMIYELEGISDINARIPETENDFSATNQGRSIGLSAIIALNDKEFLVLERDNRGVGVDDAIGAAPIGTKRVYKIDITGATDVSNISLAGANSLPTGVIVVAKSATPFLDIEAALKAAGKKIPEKFEGLAIGPQLADGTYALIIGTDNDFSVTQTGAGTQFNVCTDGTTSSQVAIDQPCPAGQTLLPSYLFGFKTDATELANYVAPAAIPTPSMVPGLILLGLRSLRKRRQLEVNE
jgi:hypothetical protein